jgi:hypothetical protein
MNNNELLNRKAQPRPHSPAPLPNLLPATAQSSAPSPPHPPVTSVPFRLFRGYHLVQAPFTPRTPIRPFGPFGPLRPFPAVACSPRHSTRQNSKISVAKRSKTAPKRPKTVTKTSKMAPNRSKYPRKRSRNGHLLAVLMTHYHSIQNMSHAHTTVYCIHLQPPALLTTRASPAVPKSPRTANPESTATEDAPASGHPPIPARGLGCSSRAGHGGWGDPGRGAGKTKMQSWDIMLMCCLRLQNHRKRRSYTLAVVPQ